MITVFPGVVEGKGFKWKTVEQPITKYNDAVAYLRQSSAAAALLDFLSGGEEVTLLCTTDTTSSFFPAEIVKQAGCNVRGSLVTWNPFDSLNVNDIKRNKPVGRSRVPNSNVSRGAQSPAVGLIHEFGHARQYMLKRDWFMTHYRAASSGSDSDRLIIENDNLLTVESVVARQLNEGVRWKYRDIGSSNTNLNVQYQLNRPMDPILV